MSDHESHLLNTARQLLIEGGCGVGLPENPEDAMEREDAFATAIYEAISDESHREDVGEAFQRAAQRLQWMSAVLTHLAKNFEQAMHATREFDANDVTDPGGGGVTSAAEG